MASILHSFLFLAAIALAPSFATADFDRQQATSTQPPQVTTQSEDGSIDTLVLVGTEELLRLQRVVMLKELQDELDAWMRKRFWTALLITTVISFFGIQAIGYLVINQVLGKKIEKATVATALMERATTEAEQVSKDVLAQAQEATAAMHDSMKDVTKQLSLLRVRVGEVDKSTTEILARAEGEAQNVRAEALLALDDLRTRMDRLVADIGTASGSESARARMVQSQEELSSKSEKRRQLFEKQSEFSIGVYGSGRKSSDVIRRAVAVLRTDGYKVNVIDMMDAEVGDKPVVVFRPGFASQAEAVAERLKGVIDGELFQPVEQPFETSEGRDFVAVTDHLLLLVP